MPANIVQKHWLKEELEMRLDELNFEVHYFNKLELSFSKQFKFGSDLGSKKLWYWFSIIGLPTFQ